MNEIQRWNQSILPVVLWDSLLFAWLTFCLFLWSIWFFIWSTWLIHDKLLHFLCFLCRELFTFNMVNPSFSVSVLLNTSKMHCTWSLTKMAVIKAVSGFWGKNGSKALHRMQWAPSIVISDNLKLLLSTVSSFKEAGKCNNFPLRILTKKLSDWELPQRPLRYSTLTLGIT